MFVCRRAQLTSFFASELYKMMKISLLFTTLARNKCLISILALAVIISCFDASVLAHDHDNRELKQVKVGLVSSINQRWGKMGLHFIQMAISDFYHDHPEYKTRLHLHTRDSHDDVVTSAVYVEDLIKNKQVVAIIGPETSQEAQFDISLGERSQVPIISYSASSPMLSTPYFIQATQNDASQVEAITSIIQAFGWREVTPIYVNNEFGGGIIPFLVDALQQINTRIPYRCVIPSEATDDQIEEELSNLRGLQTRVFVVHMNETLASHLFSLARKSGMMSSEYVWIITSNIANTLGTLDHELIQSMQGVLGVKTYVPKSKELKKFKFRWTRRGHEEADNLELSNPQMSLYGLWAYDTAFMLAQAVERFRELSFTFREVNSSSNNSSLSPAIISAITSRVSDVGPDLIRSLLNTSVRGLSGNFSIVNGRLQSSTFEIINVIGTREKSIGFWTLKNGLVKKLDNSSTSLVSKDNLGSIIWPGDSTRIPKGWAAPTKEKPLRIGVPIKVGFKEFVDVGNASSSNQTKPIGFSIDVFEAVRGTLGYDLPVEYYAASSDYDELISLVHSKEYDAVVGDVTIIANRSLYVDFTLPYMESDVLMVVPAVKDNKASKTWAFLKPLSWKLWVTTLFFFILIAFVVWVNEYQINDDFRAESWKGQIGLCLFYSFSTMVFSQKEVTKSNLSRIVMVFWVFTLLLLTQSYTASLASMLTAEKLQPAYKDVNELIRTRKKVGYQAGTFIFGYLTRMGFEDSNILPYDTSEKLNDLLSKGSEGGGIDAAFDEAPYVKLFIARHCNRYTTVEPPVPRTDGFAFVFPIGSPLVADISRGVLNVTEGGNMTLISKKWFKSEDCPNAPDTSSSTLDLDSFGALFAITGGVSVAAVLWKLALFLYENRRVWQRSDGMNFNQRMQELNRSFHAKKGITTTSSVVELESSRGCTPRRSSVSASEIVVIDDNGMTPAASPSPPHGLR